MVYSLCSYIVRMYTNYYLKPSRPLLEPFNENFITNLPRIVIVNSVGLLYNIIIANKYWTSLSYCYSKEYWTTLLHCYSE